MKNLIVKKGVNKSMKVSSKPSVFKFVDIQGKFLSQIVKMLLYYIIFTDKS